MSLRRDLERAAREQEDPAARERSWRVVRAAYEQLEPRPRRRPWRAFLATALLAVVGAAGVAAASAPRSDVGRFVRGVLGVGEQGVRPALVHVPGGGRLLVAAGDGVWIVAGDGAKRRLGAYAGASWSPRGKFAVAWRGRELTAVDPVGRVRWSLAHESAVADARWAPGDGFLVAYRTGGALRVVGGNGAADRRLAAARAGVAPAWRPDPSHGSATSTDLRPPAGPTLGAHTLAYADARGRVTVVDADTGVRRWRVAPLAGVRELVWSPRGDRLLALSAGRLTLYGAGGQRLASRSLPAGARAEHAAWAPRGSRVALVRSDLRATRSELVLLDAADGLRTRLLFARLGRFGAPAWSPSGRWLLLPWPAADQWLFLRADGAAQRTAVANIARQFAPGAERGVFPRSVTWCCPQAVSRR
jgi:hypothetical protein